MWRPTPSRRRFILDTAIFSIIASRTLSDAMRSASCPSVQPLYRARVGTKDRGMAATRAVGWWGIGQKVITILPMKLPEACRRKASGA
jgi:hypothetical protein